MPKCNQLTHLPFKGLNIHSAKFALKQHTWSTLGVVLFTPWGFILVGFSPTPV